MGFQNEKDHPEVAPSQFEINYSYADVIAAADHIQLYKLICRQVATNMGLTASFLPKPVVGVNDSAPSGWSANAPPATLRVVCRAGVAGSRSIELSASPTWL